MRDKEFLEKGLSPYYPFSCVKKYIDDQVVCGVVLHGETTVYCVNLFSLKNGKNFKNCKQQKYETLDQLLADGWMVD